MQSDTDQGQDEAIEGPLSLGLTTTGVEHFVGRGQKTRKVRFFDGGEEFGMEFPEIGFRVLQKLAMTGMVSRVERHITRFGAQRAGLMDLARCFATSVVYRQFETRLWEILAKSDVLIQWNRAFPKLTVSADLMPQGQAVQLLIQKARPGILAAKNEVLSFVQGRIQRDPKSLPEEKKQLTLLSIRYLNAVDPVIWTLIATCKDNNAAQSLLHSLKDLLGQYVNRSELPEYLACLLAELVILTMQGTSDVTGVGEQDTGIHVSFDLGSTRKSQEERTRLRIMVGSGNSDPASIKALVEQPVSTGRGGMAAAGGEGGLELGRYYLSYVHDACRRMGITMDSFVNQVPHSRKVLTHLVLTI